MIPGPGKTHVLAALFMAAMCVLPAAAAAAAGGAGSGGSLTPSLSPPEAPVGGKVEIRLDYTLPEGAVLADPLEIGGLDGLAVIHRAVEPGVIRLTVLVDRIEPWETESVTLRFADGDGEKGFLRGEGLSLAVLSNLGEKPAEARLRPLRDIVPVRPPWLKYVPWGAAAAALLFAAAAVFIWVRARRTRPLGLRPGEPPHLRARRELEQLETGKAFERGEVKAYYFAFSEILRRYLESIRSFPAAEYTTEEIGRALEREEDLKLLALLRRADLVKFADGVPTAARKEEDVKAALAYIGETSPVEGPSP